MPEGGPIPSGTRGRANARSGLGFFGRGVRLSKGRGGPTKYVFRMHAFRGRAGCRVKAGHHLEPGQQFVL